MDRNSLSAKSFPQTGTVVLPKIHPTSGYGRSIADSSSDFTVDPAQVRAELVQRRDEVQAQLDELTRPPESGATIGFGKRIGEGTTQAIQQMEDASAAQALARLLEQVDRALSKLDEGSYGRCDVCDQPIGEARIEYRPWSVQCVEHADG